ncbi:S-adenosylmethionine:tRNA ribosyltransferase-isomerase [Bacillus rubiinfantis]|uniref:S-adenosylmethionine:tRNA ribosyltransferase-isomerase n=1 Tax=Bacillus rubiinfantis TaxID=1499680 RepID=UPI0005A907E5|nr:S-adenosylmethionine:tRNA ribosyltransferase-isomerase [Bacillus rubiinfantis]
MAATAAIDFSLPENLNAFQPPERRGIRRDHVKMMVLDRKTGKTMHNLFFHLGDYLQKGDLLILNNSRTIPAVMYAQWRRDGILLDANVEIRLARRCGEDRWEALVVTAPVNVNDTLHFSPNLSANIVDKKDQSPLKELLFSQKNAELMDSIYALGEPVRYEYISYPWNLDYYQTVFASHPGSVEMPSAGRAFSWELLFQLKQKGVQLGFIQLHTGLSYLLDDSLPLTPEDNAEEYHIPAAVMEQIIRTKSSGNRVIAVGTTVVRALESAAKYGVLSGITNLYIHHLFPLKMVDGIITGFHEPKASHLDMLSAFVSEHDLLTAYHEAILTGYLWHEFGDMNLIL